jgi:hypothetical protein
MQTAFKGLRGKQLRTSRAGIEFHHEEREDHEEKNPDYGDTLLNPNSIQSRLDRGPHRVIFPNHPYLEVSRLL